MTLVKQDYRTVNDLFDGLFNNFPAAAKPKAFNTPSVNIHETKDEYHLELLAPGLKKEDFKITFEKDLLTISYEKKAEVENKDYKTLRREFTVASFKRSFSVDDKINAEAIEAKYNDGILQLLLPKKEEVKASPKEIAIL